MSRFLKSATGTPLKNEKRKKLSSCFLLPACDVAHPPKLGDLPKLACTYDKFLSKLQQFSMDFLGLLISLLSQAKKEC